MKRVGMRNNGTKRNVILAGSALLLLFATGCDPNDTDASADDVGSAILAITNAPADAKCVTITAEGPTRTESDDFSLNSGDSSAELKMKGLPLGKVTFTAEAYEAACDAVTDDMEATWVSDPVSVSIIKGKVAYVSIAMKRNGLSNVSVDFGDEPACSANGDECVDNEQCCSGTCAEGICAEETVSSCTPDWTHVPKEAMSMDVGGTGGNGLLANYSNGEVVYGEGPIYFGPHESGWVPSWYPADQLADESAPELWETISGIGGETLTGYVEAPRTGEVSFLISCDDYCSIDIPGVLSGIADNTGSAVVKGQMEAGVWYPITLDYENRWGTNWFQFLWQCL
jgi:hypothetical protein